MLLYVALAFVVLALVDTFAIVACYALAAFVYEYALVDHPLPLWWFVVQLALGTIAAGAHRRLHGRRLWSIVPLPTPMEQQQPTVNGTVTNKATTATLLPLSVVQHAWQQWSTQIVLYIHESTNNVLVATLVFGVFVLFYRRRLEGSANPRFPLGECLTAIMACLTLLVLDVFHYYDREQTLQRERAFRKADESAQALAQPNANRDVPQKKPYQQQKQHQQPIVMSRDDLYACFTSYTLLCIIVIDMVAFSLTWWQSFIATGVVVASVLVGLMRRFLDDLNNVEKPSSSSSSSAW